MFHSLLTLGLLATSSLAADFYAPFDQFDAMLPRDGGISKRQGYHPTTRYCGRGKTCVEACGPTYERCASNSGLYCFDPTIGQHCCNDMTGNSCRNGYYCTTDGAGATYCCPDGMDTVACAAAYSLTISLIRETGSVAAPSSTPIHVSSEPVPASSPVSSEAVPASSLPSLINTATTIPAATLPIPVPTGNASFTTGAPPEFTGGAERIGAKELVALAAAAVAGFF